MTEYEIKKEDINKDLAIKLIKEQFPKWSHLEVKQVEQSGWDNKTFRLGEKMLIRLPSGIRYVEQVPKEQKWLPKLAKYLSCSIPSPIALGLPSKNYPWNWSVYRWIEGKSANTLPEDVLPLEHIAAELAQFLKELHKINKKDGPPAGLHNYHRGSHPLVYDSDARSNIAKLSKIIDAKKSLAVWNAAMDSKWEKAPVWIHGDFASGNILLKDHKLTAVIDFGCMGVGDPACDLVIAWTFLQGESRKIFKDYLNLDPDTWARARAWALWKAGFELVTLKDKASLEATKQIKIINEILSI